MNIYGIGNFLEAVIYCENDRIVLKIYSAQSLYDRPDCYNLSMRRVKSISVNNFETVVNALETVMSEGFKLTSKIIEMICDYFPDKITLGQLVQLTRDKAYV